MTKILRSIVTNARAAEQTCLSFVRTCTSLSNLTQIHAQILKLGLQTNPLVLTQFASKSSNLNAIDYASTFIFAPEFDSSFYDTFLFNTIIRAYARSAAHSKHKALYFYNLMLSYGVFPNKYTYPVVLKACAGLADLNLGKSLHGCVVKYGFDDDLHVQNTLIHMYCSCDGGIAFARKVFDEMPMLDFVSWSAMIGGYARVRHLDDALKLFGKMTDLGIRPEEHTLVSLLSACGNLGKLEIGKWVASYIEKERFERTLDLSNALIDMFSKCGDVDEALRLFRNMNVLSVVSLTSVLFGLGMHGRGVEAVSLFEEMKESGMVPDDVLFIGLLSACSHSGLVEQGKHYFDQMFGEFKIAPKIQHYGCMVDMFCRAGLVGEALQFVQKMPVEPNPIIARILIDACRAQGKHELGEKFTKHLIDNEPMRPSNYVLLSNTYAKMHYWEQMSKVRKSMGKKKMRKIPGSTKIELDSEII